MKKLDFKESRSIQYEILVDIDKFCRKNDIKYFLAFGTLLGAIRHKGFIPWDDDVDIMMPLPDLVKFCETYKSTEYEVISAENSKEHNLTFPRVYNKKTFTLTGKIKGHGLGVDVYGIYGMTNSRFKHRDYVSKYYKLWGQRNRLSSIRKYLALYKIWPLKTLDFGTLNRSVLRAVETQRMYDYNKSKICVIDTFPSLPIDKRIFDELMEVPFENGTFYVPQRYDELLTLIYGEYMELPPLEDRVPYHGNNFYIE